MVKAAFIQGAALALITSCSPFGGAEVFNCETSAQCAGGTCEPTHLCSFADSACASGSRYGDHAGSLSNTCTGDSTMPDAAIDAPEMCTAGQTYCFDHAIETCNVTGTGFDAAQRVPCALTCTTTGTPSCLAASNLLATDQAMCGGTLTPVALTPTGAATVTINQNDITCNPTCGTTATIPRAGAAPNSWYCLSTINLPSTVTVTVGTATAPITLFSAGLVTIDATISFDGGNATAVLDGSAANDQPGTGGPGGFTGGVLSANDGPGVVGGGPCAGQIGAVTGNGANAAGGGGGGAGNQATGGNGGAGQGAAGGAANGGNGGGATGCSNVEGRPLSGGSGGSGGGDGGCGQGIACGWPGGGGGGALHVASRTTITGTGTLSASGGAGAGENTQPGGGGGGGAGGMLLLESPTFTFTGTLRVNGGMGGTSSSGNGGAGGAAGTAAGANGAAAAVNDRGGGGGGGGGGRIRVNATAGATCGGASPAAGCVTGALRATP